MSSAATSLQVAIRAALGHAPDVIEPGRFQRFPTSDRRSDKAGWCKLFNDMRGGVFGCYRQGISETWTAADRATMTKEQRAALARQVLAATVQRQAQQRQQWAVNADRNAQLLAQSVLPVPGDPCALYLEQRGLGGVWPLPAALRLHHALPYWDGGKKLGMFPVMLAPVVAHDGRMVALHRTYLTRDGRKAEVPEVKKLTGAAGPLSGTCIALHKPVRGCIAVAEGIETALAGWRASGLPTVAAYCAGNLATYVWPPGINRLVVFADADPAGYAAAESLKVRALRAGLSVAVMTPSTPGADWCDVWAQRAAVAVAASKAAA